VTRPLAIHFFTPPLAAHSGVSSRGLQAFSINRARKGRSPASSSLSADFPICVAGDSSAATRHRSISCATPTSHSFSLIATPCPFPPLIELNESSLGGVFSPELCSLLPVLIPERGSTHKPPPPHRARFLLDSFRRVTRSALHLARSLVSRRLSSVFVADQIDLFFRFISSLRNSSLSQGGSCLARLPAGSRFPRLIRPFASHASSESFFLRPVSRLQRLTFFRLFRLFFDVGPLPFYLEPPRPTPPFLGSFSPHFFLCFQPPAGLDEDAVCGWCFLSSFCETTARSCLSLVVGYLR